MALQLELTCDILNKTVPQANIFNGFEPKTTTKKPLKFEIS